MIHTKINNLKFDTAFDGAMKCLRNAQELCDESKLLHKNEMYARSYALSHFAREELGKSFMLCRALLEVSAGIKVDWKMLNRRFRDHKQKLLNDAAISIFLFGTELQTNGFPLNNLLLMADGQNDKKNTCLYADWDNGKFTLPSDVITQEQSERNLDLALFRVARLGPYLVELQSLKNETREKVRASYPEELVKNPNDFIDKMLATVS